MIASTVEDAPVVAASPYVLLPPRVNLLPPEIAERARLRRVQVLLAGGLAASVGLVGLLHHAASTRVDQAAAQLAKATSGTAVLQAEKSTFAEVDALYAEAAAARDRLTAAMGEEVRFSRLLDGLSTSVPEHVWLKNVTFTQDAAAAAAASAGTADAPAIGTVTFTGVGFHHDDTATWLESLEGQEGFADPYISESTAGLLGARRTVSFTSSVTLTADALSRQYTGAEGS
jgi:Tfp pilus assembly protein PilN